MTDANGYELEPADEDESEVDSGPEPGLPANFPQDSGLSENRRQFAEELKSPIITGQLFNLTHREVGDQGPEAQQAFMETVFNRASSRGMTLGQTLNDRSYYPGRSLQRANYTAEDELRYRNLASNAWQGSNISNYATGNASYDPRTGRHVGFNGGPETYRAGGERFGIEGPDLRWYERTDRANRYLGRVSSPADRSNRYLQRITAEEFVEVRPAEFPRAKAKPKFDLEPAEGLEPLTVNQHGFDLQPETNLPPEEERLLGILQRHRREAAAQGIYPRPERQIPGVVAPGNIDINNRPTVKNADGSVSTELSFSRAIPNYGEVLVPQVVNGKMLSQDEAWKHYELTGQHLGIFTSPEVAGTYAEKLHKRSLPAQTGKAKPVYWLREAEPAVAQTARIQAGPKEVAVPPPPNVYGEVQGPPLGPPETGQPTVSGPTPAPVDRSIEASQGLWGQFLTHPRSQEEYMAMHGRPATGPVPGLKAPTFEEGPGDSWLERNFKPRLATTEEFAQRAAVIPPEVLAADWNKPAAKFSKEVVGLAARYSFPLATSALDAIHHFAPEQVDAAREGLSESAADTLTAATTPTNMLILGATALAPMVGIPAWIGRGVSLGFSIAAGKAAIDHVRHLHSQPGTPEWWKDVATIATDTLFAGVLAKHGVKGLKAELSKNAARALAPAAPPPLPGVGPPPLPTGPVIGPAPALAAPGAKAAAVLAKEVGAATAEGPAIAPTGGEGGGPEIRPLVVPIRAKGVIGAEDVPPLPKVEPPPPPTVGISPKDVVELNEVSQRWAVINNELLHLIKYPNSAKVKELVAEQQALNGRRQAIMAKQPEGDISDLGIVGGGPAGLGAAINAPLEGLLQTKLFERQVSVGGASRFTSRLENVTGGSPMGEQGRQRAWENYLKATRAGAEVIKGEEIVSARFDPKVNAWITTSKDGHVYKQRALIANTGVRFNEAKFPGKEMAWNGNGEAMINQGKGGTVVVTGGANSAAQAALAAAEWGAKEVYMIVRSKKVEMSDYQSRQVFNNPKIIPIFGDEVVRIVPKAKVKGAKPRKGAPRFREPEYHPEPGLVLTKNGLRIPAKAVGTFIGGTPRVDWLPDYLLREKVPRVDRETGKPVLDKNGKQIMDDGLVRTDSQHRALRLDESGNEVPVPGLYIAGTIREGSINRVLASEGEGQRAATFAGKYLESLRETGKLPEWKVKQLEAYNRSEWKAREKAQEEVFGLATAAASPKAAPTTGLTPENQPSLPVSTTSERPAGPVSLPPSERISTEGLSEPLEVGRPHPQRTQGPPGSYVPPLGPAGEDYVRAGGAAGLRREAYERGQRGAENYPDYTGPARIDSGALGEMETGPRAVGIKQATEFYSPNEGTLDFDGALTELKKPNHQKAAAIAADIDLQLGLKGPTKSGVADTVEWGAENSLVHTIENLRDFDELRYSAALKGRALNQKSVLAFQTGDGPDAMHTMVVPNKNLNQIRKTFTEHGVPNKTLLPEGKNTRIVVYDPGHALADNVAEAANQYGAKHIKTDRGRGEFVGQGDTREAARDSFNAIAQDYEARYPDRRHYGAEPGQGRYGDRPARVGEHVEVDLAKQPQDRDKPLASPRLLSEETLARPVQPTIPPPLPAGQVLSMGDLPVTMERTGPGNVAPRDVMDSLKSVMTASGSAGEIHGGRFQTRTAKGIFRPFSEVVRLEHIDDIPTAVHETGHALMKQMYGSVKSRALSGLPPPVKNELVGLGKALYGSRRPTAGYTGEGFSEFMRYYLTRDDAAKVAPATFNFFEKKVLPDFPEVAAQLRAARDLIDMYRAQGAMARANAQVQEGPGWTRRVLGGLNAAVGAKAQFESALPLKELVREAERKGGRQIPSGEDPYKLFKARRGASSVVVDTMVEHNMVDVWGWPTGPSLREAFAEIRPSEAKKFGLYTYARRATERWKKLINPGISAADAEYIKQTLETPKFDKAFSKYQQWWDGLLAYLVQADPKMADLVARIKQGSSDYAPLARVLDERAVRQEVLKSQANPLYRMKGSGLPIKPIFEQSIVSAARLVSMANRALVTNAIFKLSRIEGMGHYMHKVDRAQVMRSVNIEKIRQDLENMGVDTTNIPADKMIDYYTPADVPKGTDPIYKYVNTKGETEWYYMEPSIYKILSNIEPFSLGSIPHIGPALDLFIGAPKRAFTLGTTGLRPTFSLVTNPIRDPQAWMMQTKTHANPAKMAAAYFQAMGELLWETATGHVGPYSKAVNNLGPQMAQPLGRDIRYTRRAVKGLFHGRLFRTVRTPVDHLRSLLNVPEAFPRLAEFMLLAKEAGWKPGQRMTPDQATELALGYKEATVDFSAAGDVSRVMNEAVPFYNPTIQGARTMVRAFRDHPYRTVLIGSAMTGLTLWNWWKNKDKEWWINLPWRERYFSNHIDDGKNVWVIPRPFEYGNIFQVIPEAAIDTWYRNNPRAATEAVKHIFETQSPLQPSILPIVSDTVIGRVAKEQWSNNIDFWDRPIVPRSESDLSPGAQVGPYTSKVATWLGKAFPNTISPKRADAAIKSYMGGVVPDLLDAVGLGAQKKDRESERADLPVIGKLWRRGGYYNGQSQHIADFYDIKETLDARSQAQKRQLRDPTRVQTMAFNPEDVMYAKIFDSSGRAITLTLRMADQIRESKGRQYLYRQAAMEAKGIVDMYNARQKLNGNGSQPGGY